MKKLIYITLAGAAAVAFSSCQGTEEYDAYVDTLKAQPQVIDTISSGVSYANYLDSLTAKANAFDQTGVKLNDTQKAEIEALSAEIQKALATCYEALKAAGTLTPAAVVAEADTVPGNSSEAELL